MKFKVLMFCPQFRPVVGGTERQAEKLAKALVAKGCQVTVLTPRLDPTSADAEVEDGVRIERFRLIDLARHVALNGIALVNIPSIILQVGWAVARRIGKYDILHCHLGSLQVAAAAWVARLWRIPVLCKAAMADRRSDFGEIEKSGLSGYLVSWLLRMFIPLWVATTDAVADALVSAGLLPHRIKRIPNGVEVRQRPRDIAWKKARHFLYLGRLSTNTERDVPTLVAAFERLAEEIDDVELALVGGGDLFKETAELVAKCRHKERILMPGFQSPEVWLNWADCFVLPSRREGLPNALLEAMAHGLACIANDIPPNREVLADGAVGDLVPIGDVDRLYLSMHRMATDETYFNTMRSKALEHCINNYDIHSVAASYISLYSELLQDHRYGRPIFQKGLQ